MAVQPQPLLKPMFRHIYSRDGVAMCSALTNAAARRPDTDALQAAVTAVLTFKGDIDTLQAGQPPLALAVVLGLVELFPVFAARVANPDTVDHQGIPVIIHVARSHAGRHMGAFLAAFPTTRLNAVACVHACWATRCPRHHTALSAAAGEGRYDAVYQLLSAGASIRAEHGWAIKLARTRHHSAVLALLVRYADFNFGLRSGWIRAMQHNVAQSKSESHTSPSSIRPCKQHRHSRGQRDHNATEPSPPSAVLQCVLSDTTRVFSVSSKATLPSELGWTIAMFL